MNTEEITIEELNLLLDDGIISEHCLKWSDIAAAYRPIALAWQESHHNNSKNAQPPRPS